MVTIGTMMALLVGVEFAVPSTSTISTASLLDAIGASTFTVTGLLAWYRRPHNRTGRLLVLMAVALLVGGMGDDEVAALRTLGRVFASVPLVVLLHLLLAFPSGRLIGLPARCTVCATYLVAVGLQIPQVISPDSTGSDTIWAIQAVLGVCALAITFALAIIRLATSPSVIRRQLGPFVGYGCAAIAIIAAGVAILHSGPDPGVANVVALIQLAAVCAMPIAFLVGMLAGAFGRAGEIQELAWGISAASVDPVLLDALVDRALGDPSASILWAIDTDGDRFVDSTGRPRLAESAENRGWWPIGPVDRPVGGLSYDRTLIADDALIATVSAPLELAIANRSLVVELRAAIRRLDEAGEQVRLSRRRIVIAADAERRRIARDLHDGAQQRIVVIGIEAQRIGRGADDPAFVRTQAASVSDQLELLLDDLRGLVHGILPAILQDRGLRAGVQALADEMPFPVRVEVVGVFGRLPAEVESTGFFVVAEALTNTAKHASAEGVVITLAVSGGRLHLTVSDDGTGILGAATGFGLRSLQDRVAALDGTVVVEPGADRGTTVRAEFACG